MTEYGPDQFFSDITLPLPETVLNEPMPRGWVHGGVIEAVKTAVMAGLRQAISDTSMNQKDQDFYIDIEYPTKITQYPGVWVQFSIDKLQRAGLGMGTWTKVNDEWGEIDEWCFDARITLTTVATTAKDRDRLSDVVVSHMSHTRSKDLSLRNPSKDANAFRGMWDSLELNPYIFITVNTDVISPGGQTAQTGLPWAADLMVYEDSYTLSATGQFNLRQAYDGVFSLAEIRPAPNMLTDHLVMLEA